MSETPGNNIGNANENPLSDITVTDASGNVLNVPENGEDARIASVYAVSVPFIVALGLSDRVVAINTKSVFWNDNVPAFKNVDSVGRGSIDFERLAKVNPTVLIHRSNDSVAVEGAERLKIPVLTIRAEQFGDVFSTLDLLATYFGVEDRAAEVETWMEDRIILIDKIVSEIPEAERVSALCLGSTLSRVAGIDMLQTSMIIRAGGKPVVEDVDNNGNWADLGTERIFAMNPDVIFVTSSAVLEYDPEQLNSDSTWQNMNAVKSGRIYTIPSRLDSWDLPGVSGIIGTFFMLHAMYPDRFSKEELQRQIDDYYNFMFGRTFEADYLGYELD